MGYGVRGHLGGGAVELLQAVLQTLHLHAQVLALLVQQAAVQLDLLQEGLGRGVVVAPLVRQVLLGHVVDAHVDKRHELAHRLLQVGLGRGGNRRSGDGGFCKQRAESALNLVLFYFVFLYLFRPITVLEAVKCYRLFLSA